MNEYRKYFDDIIEKFYEETWFVGQKIRKISSCPCCGGTYIEDRCKYCRMVNSELTESINKLETIIYRVTSILKNLPLESVPINKLFNLLYSISDKKISYINELLDMYNYEFIYNQFLSQIIIKLRNLEVKLTALEINTLETLIYCEEEVPELLYDYFIRNALLGKENISYDAFIEVMKRFTKSLMREYYTNPICIIGDKEIFGNDRPVLAISFENIIKILEDGIKDLYFGGVSDVLFTIFHEVSHTSQWKNVFNGNEFLDSDLGIRELKDNLLVNFCDNYLEENYIYLSYEQEANYEGLKKYVQYLNKLNIGINGGKYQELLEELSANMNSDIRYINGRKVDLNEFFADFVKFYPESLKGYTRLLENDLVFSN